MSRQSRRPLPLPTPRVGPPPARPGVHGAALRNTCSRPLRGALRLEAREAPAEVCFAALAIGAHGADAVGAVRVRCSIEGLEIELLRAARFSAGFAPPALVEEVAFRVPYLAVRGLVRRGRALCLSLDPTVARPYARFTLTRFRDAPALSSDAAAELLGSYAARVRARVLAVALPIAAFALVLVATPAALAAGVLGAAPLALLAAAVAALVGREVTATATWGGPAADRARDRFEATLAAHLGLAPAPIEVVLQLDDDALEELVEAGIAPARLGLGSATRRPRAGMLAAAALFLFLLGGLAFAKRWALGDADFERGPTAALAAPTVAAAAAALIPRDDLVPRCACARADSPLWKDGVPTLRMFYAPRGAVDEDGSVAMETPPGPSPDKRGRPRYDFDVAIVNDAAIAEDDVHMVLAFSREDARGRTKIVRRGLFTPRIRGGEARKWRVRAPGTEVSVDFDARGKIEARRDQAEDDGVEPASADAFWALATGARLRGVRLHGATMLAWLGDARAADAVERLGPLPAADEVTKARIRRAVAPLVACDVGRVEGALEACVTNLTSVPQRHLELREIGGAARRWAVDPVVPVHEGMRVRWSIAGDAPAEIEVVDAGP